MQKTILGILFFAVCISGCQKQATRQQATCITNNLVPTALYSSSTDITEVIYNQNHCGYLPLSKKNYWVYLDSIFDNRGQFQNTVTDTLRFKKTFSTPDGIIWWSVSTGMGLIVTAGYPDYNYSTDSTAYGMSVNMGGRRGLKWFYAINTTAVTEDCNCTDINSEWFAQRLNNPVSTPAGSFTNCMFFSKKMLHGTGVNLSTWYKPGIGALKTDIYVGSLRTRASTLLAYHIE